MVIHCRRHPKNNPSPYFVGYAVGRTGPGLVAGGGWPSSLAVVGIGLFSSIPSLTKYSPSRPESYPPSHCLTGDDMSFFAGEQRLTSLQWHHAISNKVLFGGNKGDQAQRGSINARTSKDAFGADSGVGAAGGAVAVTGDLLSGYLDI